MDSKRARRWRNRLKVWLAGGAGFALVAALWITAATLYSHDEFKDRFEALNALFAGLAFTMLILALLLQSRELRLQRRELRLTRWQLRGQKEQLGLQNVTMRKQAFETTFFQLLGLHADITRSMDLSDVGHGPKRGREAFEVLHAQLRSAFGGLPPEERDKSLEDRASAAYLRFFEGAQADIGHYFRNLYQIVRFVHETAFLTTDEKLLYTRLVRAQLSSYELAMLFYNCLAVGLGKESFKPLVEQYGLLKNMSVALLFDPNHKPLFQPAAFQSSRERARAATERRQ